MLRQSHNFLVNYESNQINYLLKNTKRNVRSAESIYESNKLRCYKLPEKLNIIDTNAFLVIISDNYHSNYTINSK